MKIVKLSDRNRAILAVAAVFVTAIVLAVLFAAVNASADDTAPDDPNPITSENVSLTTDQHPVRVEQTQNGFSFIDPATGNPLQEIQSMGGDGAEWVSLSRTSENVPVMLRVRYGLPDRTDTEQWMRDAKIRANTPTDYSFKPDESNQSSEIIEFSGSNTDPEDLRPSAASIYTPTTVTFVTHHSNSYEKQFNYYELLRGGERVLISESPVLFDSGLEPATFYDYQIIGSDSHPDENLSAGSETFNHSIFLTTPHSDLQLVMGANQ